MRGNQQDFRGSEPEGNRPDLPGGFREGGHHGFKTCQEEEHGETGARLWRNRC